MEYDRLRPWLTLDPWQKKYIETKGNCFLLCGRQSGKSVAASVKAGELAVKNKNYTILMIAFTEKQAYNLFFKTLMYLEAVHPGKIKKGEDKPTKHIINLKNGSKIMCYAAGLTGYGLVGYTADKLMIDEAAPMAREVFISVSPMLSVTGGSMDLLSTPRGKAGFFYECSDDPALGNKIRDDFTRFYISAEDCPRHSKRYLEEEKKRMSELEYAQEYLARFLHDLRRLFSDKIIQKCCILKRRKEILKRRIYYMGNDIGGLGGAENTFEILDRTDRENIVQVENETTTKKLTTATTARIMQFNMLYKFKRIYVDDGGPGFGVFSELLSDNRTKRKVIAINNASRPLDHDESRSKKILKEDLYQNLLVLMEQGKIKLLDDDELIASLASVQGEYIKKEGQQTQFRIFGNYTHIVEGLIRAAWCSKDKTLKIWVR